MIHSTIQDITNDIPLITRTGVYNPPAPFTAKLIVLLVSILDTDNDSVPTARDCTSATTEETASSFGNITSLDSNGVVGIVTVVKRTGELSTSCTGKSALIELLGLNQGLNELLWIGIECGTFTAGVVR
jgi:hypothetical protein